MSQILEATKTNAKDAALVAFGVPVVLFDRVSGRLNARLHLDSYVGLAREHAERAIDGYGVKMKHLVGGVLQIVPARHKAPAVVVDAPVAKAAAAPVAKAAATKAPATAAKKAPAAKAAAKKAVRPAPAARR